MFYDDYSTSFQSLASPMYNVQANYNVGMNGGMGGYGMGGYGMGGYGMGMGYGMDPMMNVGVGQFGDQLLLGADKNNNYHTRPVTAYKKKDDVPMMLGIFGAAAGTVALALATRGKGKGFKLPKFNWGKKKPVVPPVEPPVVNPVVPDLSKTGSLPNFAPKYISKNTAPYNPLDAMTSKEGILKGIDGYKPVVPPVVNPVVPDLTKTGSLPLAIAPKYINKNTAPYNPLDAITSKEGILKGIKPNYDAVPLPVVKNTTNPMVEDLFRYRNTGKPSFDYVKPVQPKTIEQVLAEEARNINLKPIGEYINPSIETQFAQKYAETQTPKVTKLLGAPNRENVGLVVIPKNKNRIPSPWQRNAVDTPFEVIKESQNVITAAPEAAVNIKGLLPAPAQSARYKQALAKQEAAINLPSSGNVFQMGGEAPQTFIRPVITKKGNRFANINGATVQNKLANYGLALDTKAFAQMDSKFHRAFNNLILNGTDGQIKAITQNPKYEHLFQLV